MSGISKRMCLFLLLLSCALSLAGSQANATGSSSELQELVVTATRRPTTIQNAPAVVDVITEEEIAQIPAVNLKQVLQTLTGIYAFEPQGSGIVTPQDIRLRGTFGTERVLLLVDGQPFDDPYTNYWYMSQVPLEAIQRIEVVRGPFSALYGTGALGGVIHIITKDGWGEKGAKASAGIRVGDYGRLESVESASVSDGEKASFFISHQYYETDNYFFNDSGLAESSIRDGLDNRSSIQNRVHAHGRIDPTDTVSLNLSTGFFDAETGFGTSPITGQDKNNDLTNYYINLKGTAQASKDWELFFGLDYFWRDRPTDGDTALNRNTVVSSVNTNTADRIRGNVGAHWNISDNNVLSFGAEAWRIHAEQSITDAVTGEELNVFYRQTDSLDTTENNFALFAQDDWLFMDGLFELVAGVRYDNYGKTDDAISPKGAFIWHYFDTGRVKISAAKAFRSPSVSERESPFWNLTVQPYPFPVQPPFLGPGYFAVSYESNSDLEPETLYSYDLSLENEFMDNAFTTRITPFYVEGKDFISTVNAPDTVVPPFIVDPPGPTPPFPVNFSTLTKAENIDKVEIKGVETELTWKPISQLTLFANYMYQDARNVDTDTILDFYPYHVVREGLRWQSRHFDDFLGLHASFVGNQMSEYRFTDLGGRNSGTLDGFSTFDAMVAVDFWKNTFRVTGEVYNLFDERENYKTSESVLPERNYLVGIQFNYAF